MVATKSLNAARLEICGRKDIGQGFRKLLPDAEDRVRRQGEVANALYILRTVTATGGHREHTDTHTQRAFLTIS